MSSSPPNSGDPLNAVDARHSGGPSYAPADPLVVTRSIVAAQMVFMVGHVLTTGAFLYYFANPLLDSPSLQATPMWREFLFATLLVAPEISEAFALLTRPAVRRVGSRKRTWLIGFILARLAALGIPAMAWSAVRPADPAAALGVLIASLAGMHLFQSIAYTAFMSWLSDLAPRSEWGAFFALRQIANVAVLTFLPAATTLLRRNWGNWLTDAGVERAYLAVFLAGNALLWLTILPLWRLPDVPVRWPVAAPVGVRASARRLWSSRPLRFVLASSLWLAFAQGLTQSALVRYEINVLQIPLAMALLLKALMYALQIPWTWVGGWLSDRYGDRRPLIAGLLAVSLAMGCWLCARPGAWGWIVGAYAIWGLFGLVNVCQRNLLLRTAPPSDNMVPLAVFDQLAGLCAGGAGLLGGLALGWLQREFGTEDPEWPFGLLFLVSWLGRATAVLWLLPVEETRRTDAQAV